MTNNYLNALLLAAGHGTRFLPVTEKIPKPLIPVLNMSVCEYLMRFLSNSGFKHFVLNSHHLAENFESAVKAITPESLNVSFSREKELLGTGGGIKKMIKSSNLQRGTFFISNTDAVYNFDIEKLANSHKKSGREISLVLLPFKTEIKYSVLKVGHKNEILSFSSKPGKNDKNFKFGFFTGIHFINVEKMPKFPKENIFCIVKDYYEHLIKSGYKINAIFAKNEFHEIGNPLDFYKTNFFTLNNYKRFIPFKEKLENEYREIENSVFVPDNFKLPSGCRFKAPVFIGKGSNIDSGCLIGPEVVLSGNSSIGKNSTVKNCILMNKSRLNESSHVEKTLYYGKEKLDLEKHLI